MYIYIVIYREETEAERLSNLLKNHTISNTQWELQSSLLSQALVWVYCTGFCGLSVPSCLRPLCSMEGFSLCFSSLPAELECSRVLHAYSEYCMCSSILLALFPPLGGRLLEQAHGWFRAFLLV